MECLGEIYNNNDIMAPIYCQAPVKYCGLFSAIYCPFRQTRLNASQSLAGKPPLHHFFGDRHGNRRALAALFH